METRRRSHGAGRYLILAGLLLGALVLAAIPAAAVESRAPQLGSVSVKAGLPWIAGLEGEVAVSPRWSLVVLKGATLEQTNGYVRC